MRFFKYLVLIFLFNITSAYAGFSAGNDTCFDTAQKACNYILDNSKDPSEHSVTASNNVCHFKNKSGQWYRQTTLASCQLASCPTYVNTPEFNAPGWRNWSLEVQDDYLNKQPKVCYKGCRSTGQHPQINGNDGNDMITLGYGPFEKDSSCPNTDTPPTAPLPPEMPDDPTCGRFCEKPPTGCPPGYLTGSFNNKQICYKSSPNTPNPNDPNNNPPEEPEQPQQPNACSAANCPKPDADKDCPTGYYPSTHNGEAICIRNNPNPNQPNPNDPNNNIPPSSEPVGTGDPDAKGIIDSIKALRDSLLGAIDSLSRKLTALTDGQKTTNEHLKNIKEQSTKSNEHLKKIEDGTAAASESLGDIKDYLTDESGAAISSVALTTEGISVGQIDYNIFKVNAQCPVSPNLLVTLSHTSKSFGIEYSQLCDILQYMGYLIGLVGLLHAGQILVRDS